MTHYPLTPAAQNKIIRFLLWASLVMIAIGFLVGGRP